MSDLQVGVQLLRFAERLSGIVGQLSAASESARAAAGRLAGGEGCYDGRARAEVEMFVDSYAAHIDKLVVLHTAGQRFLGKAFQEFEFADAELAGIVALWLGGG